MEAVMTRLMIALFALPKEAEKACKKALDAFQLNTVAMPSPSPTPRPSKPSAGKQEPKSYHDKPEKYGNLVRTKLH